MLIYLADLTHTGQVVASNVFPLGVGLVGANIVKEIPDSKVELFKYPEDLAAALDRMAPDVLGFSVYSWNTYVAMEFGARCKAHHPACTIIAGGPNYEPEDFWQQFPFVDYFIHREGEIACVELLRGNTTHPGVHTRTQRSAPGPRIKDLDAIPSPYTLGLMDKFFDGVLIPLIYWTKGCPFRCTFCQEGNSYYSQVAKRRDISEELDYIGQRVGSVKDMYISNANVGMANFDLPVAQSIAHVQQKYGWPMYVHCSAGKNHKAKVLQFAQTIGGRMGVAASLQSTDPQVLANVERENISTSELVEVARYGSKIDANTYSEIILNLPGDTVEKHTQSLRDAVNSGVSYLRMYQLILLPETEMNTPATRARFGLKTMWRVMPRCFGTYTLQGETFGCAEIEEIVIAQDSMSFADYLDCRELNLTVEIVHNTALFRELQGLCRVADVEWFQVLLGFHARRRDHLPGLYDHFRQHTVEPLWASRSEALSFARSHIDLYVSEQLGTNELFGAKASAFFQLQEELHDAVYAVAESVFPSHYREFLADARTFSLARKRDLLVDCGPRTIQLSYDLPALLAVDFAEDPDRYQRDTCVSISHDQEQRDMIDQLVRQYGTSNTGLGRIMLRAHITKLFRNVNGSSLGTHASLRRASNLHGD